MKKSFVVILLVALIVTASLSSGQEVRKDGYIIYTVRKDDLVSKIAWRFYNAPLSSKSKWAWEIIRQANGLDENYTIYEDQRLIIPPLASQRKSRLGIKLKAFHFQAFNKNEGAFFSLELNSLIRASSGTEPRQFARITLSNWLPTVWNNRFFKLQIGPNMSLIFKNAHFDTHMPRYTFGRIRGSIGITAKFIFTNGEILVDYLGFGDNTRPRNSSSYYSWLAGLKNSHLYEILAKWEVGKKLKINFQASIQGKVFRAPYYFGTLEWQISPSISTYIGYGEMEMLKSSSRARGIISGIGLSL